MNKDPNNGDLLDTKRLDLIYKQSTFSFIGNGTTALLLLILFWQQIDHLFLTTWFTINIFVLTLRSVVSHLYFNGKRAGKSYRWWNNIYNTGAVLTGLSWSVIGIYICANGNLYSTAVILLTLAFLMAGSMAAYATSLPTFVCFSYSAVMPLSIFCLFRPELEQGFIGSITLLMLGILTLMSYHLNRMVNKYSSYEEENVELIERLDEEKQIIIKLNNDLQNELSKQKKIEFALKEEKLKVENLVEKLLKLSTIDGLTGIPNRRHFDEYMGKEWSRCAREQMPLSLIICDIDHFKAYNDYYGHLKGDDCLRKIGSTLSEHARRGGDMAARYGGEEFAVILPNTNKENATLLAEQIHEAIEGLALEHKASKTSNVITASFGVATIIPKREILSSVLVSLADKALYEAKQGGRNRVVTMDPEIINYNQSIA